MAVVEIGSAQEFMNLLNREEQGTENDILSVDVMSDLDFDGVEYVPFTSQNNTVYMTLDFHGHCIKNIKYAPGEGQNYTYIFPCNLSGYVKNCIITDCEITLPTGYFSFLKGSAAENVTVTETVNIKGVNITLFDSVGVMKNVTMKGTYEARSSFTAINATDGSDSLMNCAIIADITCNSTGGLINIGMAPYTEMINCFSRCRIRITNTRAATFNSFLNTNFGKLFFAPRIAFCYAANKVTFTKEPTTIYGFTNGGAQYTENVVYKCYFDNTLLRGAADDERFGQPTENLKSTMWLREQGWVI